MVRVTGVFTAVEPNAILVALTLMVETMPVRLMTTAAEEVPEAAFRVALWVLSTAEAFAVNPALVAPHGTVIDAGTTSFALLLERLTATPVLGAATLSFTVHQSLVNPANVPLAHVNELTVAPFRRTALMHETSGTATMAAARRRVHLNLYVKPETCLVRYWQRAKRSSKVEEPDSTRKPSTTRASRSLAKIRTPFNRGSI